MSPSYSNIYDTHVFSAGSNGYLMDYLYIRTVHGVHPSFTNITKVMLRYSFS